MIVNINKIMRQFITKQYYYRSFLIRLFCKHTINKGFKLSVLYMQVERREF